MYKVALIGYGNWGKVLLCYLDRFFDVEYIFGRSIEKEGRFTNDLNAVLSLGIDAVVVATPIGTHYEIARQALNHNKHVFCEKPLTTDPSFARELESIAIQKRLHLVTDYTYTFSKRLQNAQRNIIGKKGIGKLRTMNLRMVRKVENNNGGVYWVLATQVLAILDMFVDIQSLSFFKTDLASKEKGSILFKGNISGEIFVDSVSSIKETKVNFFGDSGLLVYDRLHDAENGLVYAMEYFRDVLDGKIENKTNVARAISVTDVLWKLGNRVEVNS